MKPAAPEAQRATPRRISQPGDAAERHADQAARAALDPQAPAPARGAAVSAGGPPLPGLDPGEALPPQTARHFGQRLGTDLGAVRVHRDAGAAARGFGADAFALGHHVAFAPGRYDPDSAPGRALLGHELAHVAASGGRGGDVLRHEVAPTPVVRHARAVLLGDGTPANQGMTLEAFESYTRAQADWFAEPTLSAADRQSLWALLTRAVHGAHTLAGVGDLPLAALAAASAADWTGLDAFCRACSGSGTVHVASRGFYATLAARATLGHTLLGLEALWPPEVLEITVSEANLRAVSDNAWLPLITAYFNQFAPHLEGPHTADNPEFKRLLDLVSSPLGIAPFLPLVGRIRNLHRFPSTMLVRLVGNFANTRRERPLHLVLHTGHDANAFQRSARLFDDLVLNSPALVLMLEGRGSLAEITAEIPVLAASHGQPDARGVPRIAQVMIAGHGSARSIGMAGTGVPTVGVGADLVRTVRYPHEDINLDTNLAASERLFDALYANMDPAQARLVFAGCLVGSNPVPEAVAPADVAAHIAANPSLGTWAARRGVAAGMPAGFVTAARASVGLSAAASLHDARGNLTMDYAYDQAAFGPAEAYVKVGLEPEGVLVAAVEVAASAGPVTAGERLHDRLALPAKDDWWDRCTRMVVAMAVDGVARGAPVDIARLNALAHTAQIPFLVRWPELYGLTPAHFVGRVNPRGFAADLYGRLVALKEMHELPDVDARQGRLVVEQGWLALDGTRADPFVAFLDATPDLTSDTLRARLDIVNLAPRSAALFAPGAAVNGGRIRLALAWLRRDLARGDGLINPEVRAFLDAQVLTPATGPELTPAVRGQLGGLAERSVLDALGRLVRVVPPPGGGGGADLPAANVELRPRRSPHMNEALVVPDVHRAEVLPFALNVRDLPGMHGRPFAWLKRGDIVQVMGFTHEWAAIDSNGRLGYVYQTQIRRL